MVSSESIDDDQNDRGCIPSEIQPGRRFRFASARHRDKERRHQASTEQPVMKVPLHSINLSIRAGIHHVLVPPPES